MPNTLFQNKAENLMKKATEIANAMQMVDNTELDLAPEFNHIALSGAALPGFCVGTFDGQAMFNDNGEVQSVGVRHNAPGRLFELLIRREGSLTRVTERRYSNAHSLALTITAVFTVQGELCSYQELF